MTKYATIATDGRSLLRTLRRAIKIAATPPMGPVYVCLPMDVLDELNDEPVFPSCVPSTRTMPEPAVIERAAAILAAASKPVIYAGDGAAWSGAEAELARVAELAGAEIYGADTGDLVVAHPLYRGTTGHMFGSASLPVTRSGDANLIIGTYMLPEVFPELGDIYAPGAKVIHFDLNAYEIGKNHRVDLGSVCDPKPALAALAAELERTMTGGQKAAAKERMKALTAAAERERAAAKEADKAKRAGSKLCMEQFADTLSGALPGDAVIFDEALTSSPPLTRAIPPKAPGGYFCTRGGSLGIGIPGAIGAKLTAPDRTVVGFTGDGGSMYTIQALWSAARHKIGAKFVICNNGRYRLLDLNIGQYWKERSIKDHEPPAAFGLDSPTIDFAALAESMGVKAVRVEKPEEVGPAIERMLTHDGPFLIDLVVNG